MSTKLEKVARMGGKTTYKDFREGFAATRSLQGDSDADIKCALGFAQQRVGPLAVMALETKYASTLAHERALRRAWDRRCKEVARQGGWKRGRAEGQAVAMERLAGALAIRHLAGGKVVKPDIEEWGWVLVVSYPSLVSLFRDSCAWLDELVLDAERAFLEALGDAKPRRRRLAAVS